MSETVHELSDALALVLGSAFLRDARLRLRMFVGLVDDDSSNNSSSSLDARREVSPKCAAPATRLAVEFAWMLLVVVGFAALVFAIGAAQRMMFMAAICSLALSITAFRAGWLLCGFAFRLARIAGVLCGRR